MRNKHKVMHKRIIKKSIEKHHEQGERKQKKHDTVEKFAFNKIDEAMRALHAIHPSFYMSLKKRK